MVHSLFATAPTISLPGLQRHWRRDDRPVNLVMGNLQRSCPVVPVLGGFSEVMGILWFSLRLLVHGAPIGSLSVMFLYNLGVAVDAAHGLSDRSILKSLMPSLVLLIPILFNSVQTSG